MKKKSQNHSQSMTVWVFVAIIICIVGFFWVRNVRQNSITKTRFPMAVMSLDQAGKKYTVSGEYPLFSSDVPPLNDAIEKTVNDSTGEFIKTAGANWDERMANAQSEEEKPKDPFQYDMTWAPDQINARYVSVVLRSQAYEGGANMVDNVFTFNYDVAQKKFVTLGDLYPNEKDALTFVSNYAKDDLLNQYNSEIVKGEFPKDMILEGTKPTEDNFSRFTFNDIFVTFYFPKYQVAPGVYGEQKVEIPRAVSLEQK
jgi:hypothetical protein